MNSNSALIVRTFFEEWVVNRDCSSS